MFKTKAQTNSDQHQQVLPRHVAIILDGNGRWANNKHMPRFAGHRAGVEAVRGVVRACAKKQIEALTLFAFSSENWRRPKKEVSLLMDLLLTSLKREVNKLHENNVSLKVIGDRDAFSQKLCDQIEKSEQLTADNTGLKLVIAVNYGGRWDITRAATVIAEKIVTSEIAISDINEDMIESHLVLHGLPEPDLFIRTGGEKRVSNFLLWHLAYAEMYFTDTLWPDFDEQVLDDALSSFGKRQRRFGRTGEQTVELEKGA